MKKKINKKKKKTNAELESALIKMKLGGVLNAIQPLLPALDLAVPGLGTAASTAVGIGKQFIPEEEPGKVTPMTTSIYAKGGMLKKYNAPSHANGGQLINSLGNPDPNGNAEIESQESAVTSPNGETYIFSDQLGTAARINKIFKRMKGEDSISRTGRALATKQVMQENEAMKTQAENQQMKWGGKYPNGGLVKAKTPLNTLNRVRKAKMGNYWDEDNKTASTAYDIGIAQYTLGQKTKEELQKDYKKAKEGSIKHRLIANEVNSPYSERRFNESLGIDNAVRDIKFEEEDINKRISNYKRRYPNGGNLPFGLNTNSFNNLLPNINAAKTQAWASSMVPQPEPQRPISARSPISPTYTDVKRLKNPFDYNGGRNFDILKYNQRTNLPETYDPKAMLLARSGKEGVMNNPLYDLSKINAVGVPGAKSTRPSLMSSPRVSTKEGNALNSMLGNMNSPVSTTNKKKELPLDKLGLGLKGLSFLGSAIDAFQKPAKETPRLADYSRGNRLASGTGVSDDAMQRQIDLQTSKSMDINRNVSGNIGNYLSRAQAIMSRAGLSKAQTAMQTKQYNDQLALQKAGRADTIGRDNAAELKRIDMANLQNVAMKQDAVANLMQNVNSLGTELTRQKALGDQLANMNDNQKKDFLLKAAALNIQNPNFQIGSLDDIQSALEAGEYAKVIKAIVGFKE